MHPASWSYERAINRATTFIITARRDIELLVGLPLTWSWHRLRLLRSAMFVVCVCGFRAAVVVSRSLAYFVYLLRALADKMSAFF